ncbi:MFS transporter [Dactylosporangium sp. NPDC005572]|uniref:MFS transporter n=1 Tax=Dactylosporangium sp. NPDC005572 TaxID=3156889 RepID=UPI0033A461EF
MSLATVTISVVVGVPAPLNPLYQERYGIAPAVFTGAFAIYVVCAAASMLICGRLSDRLGRRTVGVAALGFSLASCLAFLFVRDSATFVLARALAGFGVGLGMSALGAFVVDLAPPGLRWMAALVTSAAAPVGTAAGAVGSGALVQYAPRPTTLGFVVAAGLVACCVLGVWVSPETVRPGAVRPSLVPTVAVPRRLMAVFAGGCLCFVACWSLGGFYQSLGATVARDALGMRGELVGGAVAAAVIGTSVVGGLCSSVLSTRRALVIGVGCFLLGVAGIAVTLRTGSVTAFLVASMLAGIGFGAGFNACLRALLDAAAPGETAGLLSAVYLIGFLGSALPNSVAGFGVERFGLSGVVNTYCVGTGLLVLAAGLVVWPRVVPLGGGTRLRSDP